MLDGWDIAFVRKSYLFQNHIDVLATNNSHYFNYISIDAVEDTVYSANTSSISWLNEVNSFESQRVLRN